MPTPRRLLVFTAGDALHAIAKQTTTTLHTGLEVTEDPHLLSSRLTLDLPILIGGDLLPEAAAAVKEVEPTALAARSTHRTAVGMPFFNQHVRSLYQALGTDKVTWLTLDLDLDLPGVPDPGQVQRLTDWLADQFPPLFDPATLPEARPHERCVPTPEGDWTYLYDDSNTVYGPGQWPFHDARDGEPVAVRMSPSAEHYAWNNEYVFLGPSLWMPDIAGATLRLYAGFDGVRHWVVDGKIRLYLAAGRAQIHPDIPDLLREQAQRKADRLLAAVAEHRAARDSGATEPVTAWEIFHPDQAAKLGDADA